LRSAIALLHGDELSCVLAFSALRDLMRLVCCSHRFHAVVSTVRCLGLHLKGGATIVPPSSSTLSHHVTSLHLERPSHSDAPLTRDILRQLRGLPRLTALQLSLAGYGAVDHIMEGLTLDNAAATLRALLPSQLRSFSVTLGSTKNLLSQHNTALASSICAAVVVEMPQLTELGIEQHSKSMNARLELALLPHLRKLTLGPARFMEDLAELKQLSQLCELSLHDDHAERIRLLCQLPHALQLECLTLSSDKLVLDVETMRALLHLPTLTVLNPGHIQPDAWSLLPQLPLLRRFRLHPSKPLTLEQMSSLCEALSRCSALVDLTLRYVSFVAVDGTRLTAEQTRANWTDLLGSVPRLRRLGFHANVTHFLPVLPSLLPQLDHLALSGSGKPDVDHFAAVAHPNIRILECCYINLRFPSIAQVRFWLGRERLPKLEQYIRADCVV
jgi:hypothetical protein